MNNKTVRSQRQYPAESEAAPLIQWLNAAMSDKRGQQSFARVADIWLLFIRRAKKREEAKPFIDGIETSEETRTALASLLKVRQELNDRLSGYSAHPAISDSDHLVWRANRESRNGFLASLQTAVGELWFSELDAVMRIAQLSDQKELERVRPCQQCSRWFFARYLDRSWHCSKQCQQKHYKSSEEYKELRRKQHRQNYLAHKSGAVK